MIEAYYKRLTSKDYNLRVKAAFAWARWEASTSRLRRDKKALHHFDDIKIAEAFSRIECHYFINKGFFKTDNWILDNVDKIQNIPCDIVQGRYDVVCPMKSAWELSKKLKKSKLHIIENAGHSMLEEGIQEKLIYITDKYVE